VGNFAGFSLRNRGSPLTRTLDCCSDTQFNCIWKPSYIFLIPTFSNLLYFINIDFRFEPLFLKLASSSGNRI
jgi:hypothetical protein